MSVSWTGHSPVVRFVDGSLSDASSQFGLHSPWNHRVVHHANDPLVFARLAGPLLKGGRVVPMQSVMYRLRVWFRRYFLGYGQYRYQRDGRYLYEQPRHHRPREHRSSRLTNR
jgi:hypothetical protein